MAKKIIEINHVYKDYGTTLAVEDFHFYVNKGEFVTFRSFWMW